MLLGIYRSYKIFYNFEKSIVYLLDIAGIIISREFLVLILDDIIFLMSLFFYELDFWRSLCIFYYLVN